MTFANNQLHIPLIAARSNICVTNMNDFGSSYFDLTEETSGGNEEIVAVPGKCRVAITQAEYVPAVFSVYPIDTLQNEFISEHSWVFSNCLQIGRNVTNTEEEGPVIIEDGNVTIRNNGELLIKNDFEVKKGASLLIHINN